MQFPSATDATTLYQADFEACMRSPDKRSTFSCRPKRTTLAFALIAVALPGREIAAQDVASQRVAVTGWVDSTRSADRNDDSRSCTRGVVRKAGIVGLFAAALGAGYMIYLHAEWPAVDQPSTGEFFGLVGAGLVMGAIDGYVKTSRCRRQDDPVSIGMARPLSVPTSSAMSPVSGGLRR